MTGGWYRWLPGSATAVTAIAAIATAVAIAVVAVRFSAPGPGMGITAAVLAAATHVARDQAAEGRVAHAGRHPELREPAPAAVAVLRRLPRLGRALFRRVLLRCVGGRWGLVVFARLPTRARFGRARAVAARFRALVAFVVGRHVAGVAERPPDGVGQLVDQQRPGAMRLGEGGEVLAAAAGFPPAMAATESWPPNLELPSCCTRVVSSWSRIRMSRCRCLPRRIRRADQLSRSSYLRTLPVELRGSCERNSTWRGTL